MKKKSGKNKPNNNNSIIEPCGTLKGIASQSLYKLTLVLYFLSDK